MSMKCCNSQVQLARATKDTLNHSSDVRNLLKQLWCAKPWLLFQAVNVRYHWHLGSAPWFRRAHRRSSNGCLIFCRANQLEIWEKQLHDQYWLNHVTQDRAQETMHCGMESTELRRQTEHRPAAALAHVICLKYKRWGWETLPKLVRNYPYVLHTCVVYVHVCNSTNMYYTAHTCMYTVPAYMCRVCTCMYTTHTHTCTITESTGTYRTHTCMHTTQTCKYMLLLHSIYKCVPAHTFVYTEHTRMYTANEGMYTADKCLGWASETRIKYTESRRCHG